MELISMSKYNTAQETTAKAKTLTKADNRGDYIMKGNTSANHESIIRNLFNALFVSERQHSIKTDHTPTHPTMMTLDIYQVQQLMQSHCGKLITHMEIVDALYDLEEPKLLQPSTIAFNSELDGKRINAIRLIYNGSRSGNCDTEIIDSISKTTQTFKKLNQVLKEENELGNAAIKNKQNNTATPETDEIALELSQVTFAETPIKPGKWETDAKAWKTKALKLHEQQTIDRDTIQSLRGIIIDMAETLHVADPNARISMTSSDLLDLVHSQKDMSDNAF